MSVTNFWRSKYIIHWNQCIRCISYDIRFEKNPKLPREHRNVHQIYPNHFVTCSQYILYYCRAFVWFFCFHHFCYALLVAENVRFHGICWCGVLPKFNEDEVHRACNEKRTAEVKINSQFSLVLFSKWFPSFYCDCVCVLCLALTQHIPTFVDFYVIFVLLLLSFVVSQLCLIDFVSDFGWRREGEKQTKDRITLFSIAFLAWQLVLRYNIMVFSSPLSLASSSSTNNTIHRVRICVRYLCSTIQFRCLSYCHDVSNRLMLFCMCSRKQRFPFQLIFVPFDFYVRR